MVQRQTSETPPQDNISQNLESQLTAQKGGGSPLSDEVRGFMEPRFGADFSDVRVHTGSAAVQMNQQLGAQAFTHGNDIYYGKGKAPGNDALTAHELTHTIQQKKENIQRRIQRQSIHNPLFNCYETSLQPGGMSYFGTLVHLAIQQHYVSNIDPSAATEYKIPGSSLTDRTGRADIVSSSGGIYEIKPRGLVRKAFMEAENYQLHAEHNCDPSVNWHLGTIYYPPAKPMIINGEQIYSWLYAPGVIAYTRRKRKRQVPQQERVPQTVPRDVLDKIMEFARKVIQSGVDAEKAASEFLQDNPELVWPILVLGTVGIIALLADNAIIIGLVNDVLIPVIAVLMRVAWRYAFKTS